MSEEVQRFTAGLCGIPVRSQQASLAGVAWGLYALSSVAVLARIAPGHICVKLGHREGVALEASQELILGLRDGGIRS